ncbi:hypothetical protein KEM55_007062 [Ascosphaera atra]|nr:hypothetical protein KEM55_007062 [Ascosphaera atra]
MSLSTPTSVDRDPSPPSMHKPEETFQFPYTDPSASRVIRIETDPCFSDSGYNPPVNHSSAAATERVMSLLGSLQPVISSARSNLTTWQSQQPVHDESFMQQAVFSKKRKFEDEADLSFGAESYQPNKRREYLDYFSFYDVPQTAQRYASVESTEAPSEISETQVTSTSLTYTKRRRRLTANERKRNRVLSEKQRREELKGRLDEICAMVPGLHSNLGTKSFVLQQVADWLQNLLGENRKLQSYLKELPPC